MGGIRLDSGDLAWLSIEARKLLDAAGFSEALIVASNDLDEHLIESLKHQGAKIAVWGVGTKLVTAYDQPALGGVYKLAAIRPTAGQGPWNYRVKLSEQAVKISTPGIQQVRRFRDPGTHLFVGDVIYDEEARPRAGFTLVDPADPTRRRPLSSELESEDLLVPLFRAGQRVYDVPSATEARERTRMQLAQLSPWSRRIQNPHEYPVGLEAGLAELRNELVTQARRTRAA
jgi:nicotinate phosphoribosyltransferase